MARVFHQLGGNVVLTGFVGRQSTALVEPLRQAGIEVDVVEAYDTSRTCTIIVDPANRSHPTVINEESPRIEPGATERLMRVVDKWLPRCGAVLVTGSRPQGLELDFYGRVLDQAACLNKFSVLDAVVRANPGLLKLNAEEFAALANLESADMDAIVACLRDRPEWFPEQIIVTFGQAGAILRSATAFVRSAPPVVFHANPIGSGDAFAAGYILEWLNSGNEERAFRLAVAVSAANAASVEPSHIDVSQVRRLLDSVVLENL